MAVSDNQSVSLVGCTGAAIRERFATPKNFLSSFFCGFPLHPLPLFRNGKEIFGDCWRANARARGAASPRARMRTLKYRITTRSARCNSTKLFKVGSSNSQYVFTKRDFVSTKLARLRRARSLETKSRFVSPRGIEAYSFSTPFGYFYSLRSRNSTKAFRFA